MALVKLKHKISGRTATLNEDQVESAKQLGFVPVDELEQPSSQQEAPDEQEQEEAASSEAQEAAESEEAQDVDLTSKTNAELREMLTAHGLPTDGNKADLVARLETV